MFSNRELRKLLIPLVIEQILVMLVGMVDTLMVSSAGEAAVSGVALVDMVNYLIITVMAAVATGGAVVVSQYLGGKQPEQANKAAGQLIMAAAFVSLIIMAVCLLFCRQILHLLFGAVEDPVMEAALIYFMITACSFPFLGVYDSAAALFRSMGRTSVTMYVSIFMNVVNIIGDSIGVLILHTGVWGVAVSTLISRGAAAILIMRLAFGKRNAVSLCWKNIFTWNRGLTGKILHIAVPGGVENGLFALGRVLVTSIVSLFGTTQIAANGVANSVDQIAVMVVGAVNLAIITVVGQCIGAREFEQAKGYTRKLMKVSYLSTAALGGAVCICLPLILGFYNQPADTLRLSAILIVMHNLLALALHPTSFNLANSLRASGDVKFTMFVGISSMLLFRLGSAVLFGIVFHLGVLGVWIAMGMDWLARSAAFTVRYRSERWKTAGILL